jgi:hypothetical protein
MERPRQPSRREEYLSFVSDLLDSRFEIEAKLEQHATEESHTFTSVFRQMRVIPEFLAGVPGISRQMTIAGETTGTNNNFRFSRLVLETEDSLPVVLLDEQGLFTMRQGDDVSLAPSDAPSIAARSFFPERYRDRLSDAQIFEHFSHQSPELARVRTFRATSAEGETEITFSAVETDLDTTHTLQTTRRYLHACGKMVGTRLTVFESMLKRQANESSDPLDHALNIDVEKKRDSPIITVEDILDGDQTVTVKDPTLLHIEQLLLALQDLDQAT